LNCERLYLKHIHFKDRQAIPTTNGPEIRGGDGLFISPIRPPKSKYEAVMLGLRPAPQPVIDNTEMEHDEEDWECEDLRAEERLNQITASFNEECEKIGDRGKKAELFWQLTVFNVDVL
jgi:hypothetical protein